MSRPLATAKPHFTRPNARCLFSCRLKRRHIHRSFSCNRGLIADQYRTAHALAEQASNLKSVSPAISYGRIFSAANRRPVRGVNPAHIHTNLDASSAAAIRLRKSFGANARDSNAGEEPAAR